MIPIAPSDDVTEVTDWKRAGSARTSRYWFHDHADQRRIQAGAALAGPGAGLGAGALRPAPRRGRHPRPRQGRLTIRSLLLAAVVLSATTAPAAAQTPTDDPLAPEQVVLTDLGLPAAWANSTGEGVAVAVLDSGVDPAHPDLVDHLGPGRDEVDGDDAPDDRRGTGTHAAGVAAAVTGNGIGIAGAAPGATLLPVRVLDDDGRADPTTVASAVAWAAEEDAGVIALTLGGDTDLVATALADADVDRAVRAADRAGSVVLVAGPVTVPDDLPVLAVAPTGTDPAPATVLAPGADVLGTAPTGRSVTWPGGTEGYEALDGAGPATAAVAGVAALLVGQGRTPEEVRDLLAGTTHPDGSVDAEAATTQAASTGAGGVVVPSAEEGTDGSLPPFLVGALALGAPTLALGLALVLGRRPAAPDDDG